MSVQIQAHYLVYYPSTYLDRCDVIQIIQDEIDHVDSGEESEDLGMMNLNEAMLSRKLKDMHGNAPC